MCKNYTFQKKYQNLHYYNLEFCFSGYHENENLNREEIEALLDNCFETKPNRCGSNIVVMVTWLRTIFRDFNNGYLELSASYKNKKIKLAYNNNQLLYYNLEEILYTENSSKNLFVNYSEPFDFHMRVEEKKLNTIEPVANYEKYIKETMQLISTLSGNIEAIELNENDKILCQIYQLFYGKTPDFSQEMIYEEVQTMICAFKQFHLDINLDNYYHLPQEMDAIPFTPILLNRLVPLGKISKIEKQMPILQSLERKIETIGYMFRKYTDDNPQLIEQLGTIIYCGNYDLVEFAKETNVDYISTQSYYSIEDVEESIELVRKINNKLEEDQE